MQGERLATAGPNVVNQLTADVAEVIVAGHLMTVAIKQPRVCVADAFPMIGADTGFDGVSMTSGEVARGDVPRCRVSVD